MFADFPSRLGVSCSDDICTDFLLHRLEERRKVKGAAYYERKRVVKRTLAKAKSETGSEETKKQLAELGY